MITLVIVIFLYILPFIYGTLKLAHFFMLTFTSLAKLFPQASATVTTRLYISPTVESSVVHKKKRKSVFCVNGKSNSTKGLGGTVSP